MRNNILLNMWGRVQPFVALLDARYLPLLFAVSPQSYAVYKWLWIGSDQSHEAWYFAILGALGYELIYVGAIAWTEHQTFNGWTRATAWTALFFSIAIAVYVYRDQSYAAALHAGFPIVAFAYTMAMHTHNHKAVQEMQVQDRVSLWERIFGRENTQEDINPLVTTLQAQLASMQEAYNHLRDERSQAQVYARSVQAPEPMQVQEMTTQEIVNATVAQERKPRTTQGESKKQVVWRLAQEGMTSAEIIAETGYDKTFVQPEMSRYKKAQGKV